MILLVGQSAYCSSLDRVMDWLWYYEADFLRINAIDFIKDCEIKISKDKTIIRIGRNEINLDAIGVVWFRRFFSVSDFKSIFLTEDTNINRQINHALKQESRYVLHYIIEKLKPVAFNFTSVDEINKLVVLERAREHGILIPETVIGTACKREKEDDESCYITKAISNSFSFRVNHKFFSGYTAEVSEYAENSKYIFPSLFQKKIEKEFEIRTFVLDTDVYSMAMFTQSNKRTSLDFRKYDNTKPSRCVPFKLPTDLEQKIICLFKDLNLRMGSVDLIKCKLTGQIFFLEINPEGQYDMVSGSCNYNLHEKIALKLIEKDYEHQRRT